MNGFPAFMIANYLPLHNDPHVPTLVIELRKDFDQRIMDLYKQAVQLAREEPITASDTVHVPYEAMGLHVVAIFHMTMDIFTQIIARPVKDAHAERPEYTISLFLATHEQGQEEP